MPKVLRKPNLFRKMRSLPNKVSAGVAVKGPAARYALVWEWGTTRFTTPGPKTTYGSNPDGGEVRMFTKTAPSGYIRIHKQQFFDMAVQAVSTIDYARELPNNNFAQALQEHLNMSMTEAAQIMANDAPIDSGLLRASIVAVDGDEMDSILAESFRPLVIGGESHE